MGRYGPAEIPERLEKLDGARADALESEDLELEAWEDNLRDLTRHLRETVVCLANQRGGTLVLGVRDRVRTRSQAIQGVGSYDARSLS